MSDDIILKNDAWRLGSLVVSFGLDEINFRAENKTPVKVVKAPTMTTMESAEAFYALGELKGLGGSVGIEIKDNGAYEVVIKSEQVETRVTLTSDEADSLVSFLKDGAR